jgi:hypothetical protein
MYSEISIPDVRLFHRLMSFRIPENKEHDEYENADDVSRHFLITRNNSSLAKYIGNLDPGPTTCSKNKLKTTSIISSL